MHDAEFVEYYGDPDFHDGVIVSVVSKRDDVRVGIKGASGRDYDLLFRDVESVEANRPVGMMLYALSLMKTPGPMRRFAFANWDDGDDACLEIVAGECEIVRREVAGNKD